MLNCQTFVVVWAVVAVCQVCGIHYEPTWKSLDARPLPAWFDESKFGIILHWGVFSVPSNDAGPWFQYRWQVQKRPNMIKFMKENYRPDFTYADFAPQLRAELHNPEEWVDIFSAAGARYVVLTSKHHDGFCNWATEYSFNWNSVAVGPRKDIVGDLAYAVWKRSTMKFGLYHSLFEFVNPVFLQDQKNQFKTQDFVRDKTMPELYELVNLYRPEIIWSDGDWMAPSSYWNSTHFLAWLYNDSPVKDTVVTNDRWGSDTRCKHGGYYTCRDKYNPGVLQKHKFEDATTIDKKSWGYRRTARLCDFHTTQELISQMVEAISCGGNYLLNVGPTPDGRISLIYEERLRQIGEWLNVTGEAIYGTRPWIYQNDTVSSFVWYTCKKTSTGMTVFAISLKWPSGGTLTLGAPEPQESTTVTLMGYPGQLKFKASSTQGMDIMLPSISVSEMPCRWAWVFVLKNL